MAGFLATQRHVLAILVLERTVMSKLVSAHDVHVITSVQVLSMKFAQLCMRSCCVSSGVVSHTGHVVAGIKATADVECILLQARGGSPEQSHSERRPSQAGTAKGSVDG